MTDPAKNTNAKIEESGFDMNSKERPPPDKKQNKRQNRISVHGASALALVLCVILGGAYWSIYGSKGISDMLAGLQNEEPAPRKPGSLGIEGSDIEQKSFLVEQGSDGVKINGHRELATTLLLQNYPTREELRQELARIRGADVSKEELDAFSLSMRNNADEIRRLKASRNSGSNEKLTAAINDVKTTIQELREDMRAQKTSVAEMNNRLETLGKNTGRYHNRLSKLEENLVVIAKKYKLRESEVRRVELESQFTWAVNGASENLAFIQNTDTGKRLRVTRGFDIPGCGQVIDISPEKQKITTTSCVIAN